MILTFIKPYVTYIPSLFSNIRFSLVLYITLLLGPNTIPLLRDLRPEDNYLSFIPLTTPKTISKSIYYCRRILLNNPGDPVIYRCSHCIRRDKEYKLGGLFDSCTICIVSGLLCELSFSKAKLHHI